MSRILVTGGDGFIGRATVETLRSQGHEVHATCRRQHAGAGDDVVWHHADLFSSQSIPSLLRSVAPTHLLHLAWYTAHGRFWTADENVDWIAATLELLRAFGNAGGSRAVVVGSCAEYRWGDDLLLDESTTPLVPATLYGACKLATQIAGGALAARREFEFAWGRIFHLYGPRENPNRLVAAIARGLLSGQRVPTSDGHQIRDFLHVDDVAGSLAALVDSDTVGAVNIASGRGVPVRDVVRQLGVATGRLDQVDFGALDLPSSEPERIVAHVGRLTGEVGYTPRIALADGLTRTVEWWRGQPASE